MVRRLINLELYSAVGKDVASVFRDDFYRPGTLTKLVHAEICLQPSEEFEEEDRSLFIAASRIPSLRHLEVQGMCESLPLDLVKFAIINPVTRPPPGHSWGLTSLVLSRVWIFGAELRFIFGSLYQLEVLKIEGCQADSSFARNLSLLPKTLHTLTITLLGDPEAGESSLPTLDYVPLWFPNLEHFHLTGDIFSHSLFHNLRLAPKLHCLLFGHDSAISTDELLSLVLPTSPNRTPQLSWLDVHVCWKVSESARSGGVKKPIWTDELSKKGARKLATMCKEGGLTSSGGVTCALKICQCQERGRKCQREF
jgi:hypothetical protein